MNFWPIAIFVSSLAGSLHCAGMCGGFGIWAGQIRQTVPYHLGRLTSYCLLGAVAGAVGQTGLNSVPSRYQVAIGIGLGLFIIINGITILTGGKNGPGGRKLINLFRNSVEPVLRKTRQIPSLQGMILGMGSVLLPCGWLYSFVLAAAATGSISRSIILMTSFWAGTVPALLIGTTLWKQISLRFQVRYVQAAVLILIGLLTVGEKLRPVFFPSDSSCHSSTAHPL